MAAAAEPMRLAYNLNTRQWQVSGQTPRSWMVPPPVTQETLRSVSIKGRSSHEEKEAWATGVDILLGQPPWTVGTTSEFTDIERLVVVLIVRFAKSSASRLTLCPTWSALLTRGRAQKYVEHWAPGLSPRWAWCVGGSLQATISVLAGGQVKKSHELRFVLCAKSDWAGNGKGKLGNSCKRCCDGVSASTVAISGRQHPGIVLKKCTWLKCCYGRRAFGGAPPLPWGPRCEQRKKMEREAAAASAASQQTAVRAQAKSAPKGSARAKRRKVTAPVPVWPADEAAPPTLSPAESLITPRGREAARFISGSSEDSEGCDSSFASVSIIRLA